MVLKKILKKPEPQEEEEEIDVDEEPDNSEYEEEKEKIQQRINKLDQRKPLKPRNEMSLRVVNKDQVPFQRLETIQGESGEIYEVITIEEALAEILSILRDSA